MKKKSSTIIGLKELEKKSSKLNPHKLADIFFKLTQDLPRLQIKPVSLGKQHRFHNGDELRFHIQGIPLPDINLYVGQLEKNTQQLSEAPLLATFEGVNGPITSECSWDPMTGIVQTKVPDGSVTGMVIFHIPVWVLTGPLMEATMSELVKTMQICNPSEELRDEGRRIAYLPYIADYSIFTCGHCRTDSICPYGAILFDVHGNCYVDQSICRGLSHEIIGQEWTNGRWLNVRGNQHICWQCFLEEESLSKKCLHRKVGRVLEIGGC